MVITEVKLLFDGDNFFWSNQGNGTNIYVNDFPPQNELHTAKLSLSGVMKYFRGNRRKTSFLG